MTPEPAPDLEGLLDQGPPIIGSSVPRGEKLAYRYAFRLEQRNHKVEWENLLLHRVLEAAQRVMRDLPIGTYVPGSADLDDAIGAWVVSR